MKYSQITDLKDRLGPLDFDVHRVPGANVLRITRLNCVMSAFWGGRVGGIPPFLLLLA